MYSSLLGASYRHLCRSRRILYVLGVSGVFFILFLTFRGIFYFGFSELSSTLASALASELFSEPLSEAPMQEGKGLQISNDTLMRILFIGIRFDLRLALLIAMPVFILAALPRVNLTTSRWLRGLVQGYTAVVAIAVIAFYIVDLGHYAYLGQRMDATILRFATNVAIATTMMWESYPLLWILLGWFLSSLVVILLIGALARATIMQPRDDAAEPAPAKWQVGVAMLVLFLLMSGWIFGRFSTVPLRWNHAYFTGDARVTALGLNPILFFYDSFNHRSTTQETDIDAQGAERKARQYYPLIADYLGVTARDAKTLNYDRRQEGRRYAVVPPDEPLPNVVFIMLESLGASRVGLYGNPLKPTPTLDALAESGIWAPHFYVPISGTARTVFGSITGIPDVSLVETASRNPLITEQRVVLNYFTEHEKYYFIGGSAGWANMSAFIKNSIQDMQLYEEGDYTEPEVDVWGISDLSLFKEFDRRITRRDKRQPFVAILQTAGNHRPFTIPDDNDGFNILEVAEEELHQWGYKSQKQFNAVRLLDFNINRLMELAKQGGYYENTIFIMYGDHNNRITQTPHMHAFHTRVPLDLDGLHVPFIMHAPKYLKPQKLDGAYSLLDLMPTVAALLGIDYVNTTMGRNVFAPVPEGERAVFVQAKAGPQNAIGMLTKNFALRMLDDTSAVSLHQLHSSMPEEDVQAAYPEKTEAMRQLLIGFYETSKFQLRHNSRHSRGVPTPGLNRDGNPEEQRGHH